jgi:hypothetical protein
MKLVLVDVSEVVLVVDARWATVYIKQGGWPNATIVFDNATDARRYIRSLANQPGTTLIPPPSDFMELDLVRGTERKLRTRRKSPK